MEEADRKKLDGEILRLVVANSTTYVVMNGNILQTQITFQKDKPWPAMPGQEREPLVVGRILPDLENEVYRVYAFPMTEEHLKDENGNPIKDADGTVVEPVYRNEKISIIAEVPFELAWVERLTLLETAEEMSTLPLPSAVEKIENEYAETEEPPANGAPAP